MTEIALHQPSNNLTEVMDYARAVSVASMLPENYRGKPADIMLAVGLGTAMGLSPAESLYRISVIKGKPTASAELIAANVRKAGHRLRVISEPGKATATIVRADDPDFEFTVVRDMAWAQQMGLASNDNYRKQGDTMLAWRAISACARLACPEALYGVAYTPDEMGDGGARIVQADASRSGADRMRAVLNPQAPVDDATASGGQIDTYESPYLKTSSALAKRMFATLGKAGLADKEDRLQFCSATVGRTVTTSSELTDAEAEQICAAAEAVIAADDPATLNDPALYGDTDA